LLSQEKFMSVRLTFEERVLKAVEAVRERAADSGSAAALLLRDASLLFSRQEAASLEAFTLADGAEVLLPFGVVLDTLAVDRARALSLVLLSDGRLVRFEEAVAVAGAVELVAVRPISVEAAQEAHGLAAIVGGLAAQALRLARAGRGSAVLGWLEALEAEATGDTVAA